MCQNAFVVVFFSASETNLFLACHQSSRAHARNHTSKQRANSRSSRKGSDPVPDRCPLVRTLFLSFKANTGFKVQHHVCSRVNSQMVIVCVFKKVSERGIADFRLRRKTGAHNASQTPRVTDAAHLEQSSVNWT